LIGGAGGIWFKINAAKPATRNDSGGHPGGEATREGKGTIVGVG